ncbi:hypothetical protein T4A_12756 [Trichinella pseudospiralis]|uniref:Uncharacterized protein n=1 Tax=Trichinella pseudospiralis TaxID=6337 RepID=A0A0V1E4S1_TRIPS|nr:hypothetical protein T4A_12756 [Trichinella pseudospiralis]
MEQGLNKHGRERSIHHDHHTSMNILLWKKEGGEIFFLIFFQEPVILLHFYIFTQRVVYNLEK